MRWLVVACLSSLLGCEQLDAALPVLSRATPIAGSSDAVFATGKTQDSERLAAAPQKELVRQIRALRQRLNFASVALDSDVTACKDLRLGQLPLTRLPVAVVDARTTTRSLIPRRVTERLESEEIAMLREASDATELGPGEAAPAFAARLRELSSQSYVGVFYVTDYLGPALILRVGELRRSWYAGTLAVRFVLYDTSAQKPVCGQLIRVQNDVKVAPIRSRLQSETRGRLERELADAAVAEALGWLRRDLPQVSFSLRFTEGSK